MVWRRVVRESGLGRMGLYSEHWLASVLHWLQSEVGFRLVAVVRKVGSYVRSGRNLTFADAIGCDDRVANASTDRPEPLRSYR